MSTYNLKVVDIACKFKDKSVYESFVMDYEDGLLGKIITDLYTAYKLEEGKLDNDALNEMIDGFNNLTKENRELQKQNLQLMRALGEINGNINSLSGSIELVNNNVTKVGNDLGNKLAITANLGERISGGSTSTTDEMEKELQELMGDLPVGDIMIEAPVEVKVEEDIPQIDMTVATYSKKKKKSRFGLRR